VNRIIKFLDVKPGGTERNHWALKGKIIGNGKAVSVLYELRVIEAYGWTRGIALPTLNEPVYYSLPKVRILYAPDSKTALYTGSAKNMYTHFNR
jgi:hypothetical protein